ncbi:hypothetical protein K4K54_011922 [Colletotrichum sp. SAR 10_86]|nr:hypothetical protein K4K54_011922 [Colletotrichum sp. SAR 10_86]
MRNSGANTSRPLRPRAARLAPDNPSSENTVIGTLHAAVSSASQAILRSDTALASHWKNICAAFIASGITTPFADWLTQVFGNQHNLLTLVRAAFATQWRHIEESCSREEVGRRRSAANRLGLDEVWLLYLWFGASVQSQRCWKELPPGSAISARQLFVELRRIREQQPRGKHYLEKSFGPREFEIACGALTARGTNQQPDTRGEQGKSDVPQQGQVQEQRPVEKPQQVEKSQQVEKPQQVEKSQQVEKPQQVEKHAQAEEYRRVTELYRLVYERRQVEEQQRVKEQRLKERADEQKKQQVDKQKEQQAGEQETSKTGRRQSQLQHDDSGFFDGTSDNESDKQQPEDDSELSGDTDTVDMGTRASSAAAKGKTSPNEPSTIEPDPKSQDIIKRISAARSKLDAAQDDCAAKKSEWEEVAQSETSAMLTYKKDIDARVSSIMRGDVQDFDREEESGEDDEDEDARGLGELEQDLKAAASRKRKASRQIESLTAKSQRLHESKETMLAQFESALEGHLERIKQEEETIVGPGEDR